MELLGCRIDVRLDVRGELPHLGERPIGELPVTPPAGVLALALDDTRPLGVPGLFLLQLFPLCGGIGEPLPGFRPDHDAVLVLFGEFEQRLFLGH